MEQNESHDVVIIGAGPAGLTAAYEILTKTDLRPVVLEASNEIGGISRTVEHHGNRMDLGGHRFFSKSDVVMDFWKNRMPLQGMPARDDLLLCREVLLDADGPDPEKEDRVMLVRRRVSRIYYLRKFFDYPISMKPATFLNMGFGRTFCAGVGYLWSVAFKRKENTLRDFMINRFGVPLYKMFFEDYTRKVWGRDPKEISASWGKQRIRGISLTKALLAACRNLFRRKNRDMGIEQKKVETSLIEQFLYPKKGPGQLWETVAEDLCRMAKEKFGESYEVVRKDAPVTKIRLRDGKIESVLTGIGESKKDFTARYFISSMPVKDLVLSFCGESIPEDAFEVAAGLPYRDFITVGLLLKKLKIQNTTAMKTVGNIVPDCWIYIQERDVRLGRLQIFNNWSPYMATDLENSVWIGLEYFCNEGDELWSMSDAKFIDFAITELCKIQLIDRDAVLDSIRVKVPKAYPAYFGTYEQFDVLRKYLDTIGNLYCVGRNGQHRYNNMDHSMLTAIEAVQQILRGSEDKTSLWNVNADQEYHESK
ncbi:MAG: NAD(P)/FAD-dependent oxidoreductase [Planctomycetia bacterium]|nr:NAD(P)/FAD-dependent oxidoreductase [Planctomycetia bacterium]